MSAQIVSVDSVLVTSQPQAAPTIPALERHVGFENGETHGLRAAKGITFGVLLSVPAWMAIGAFCYLVF